MNATKTDRRLSLWLGAIVIVHLAVGLWHGAAHVEVPVPLNPVQTAFVWVVITFMPLAGLALLWTNRRQAAALVIGTSMLASLLFGVFYHFIHHSPDHVAEVPDGPWRRSFVLSAVAVAVAELLGTLLGAVAAFRWRRPARLDGTNAA